MILNQVQNDANRGCHPDAPPNRHSDESIVLMKIRIIPLVLTQIPDQVRNDGTAVVILTLIVIVILTKALS